MDKTKITKFALVNEIKSMNKIKLMIKDILSNIPELIKS